MKLLKKVINDWFTGIDGETMDPARFLWMLGMFAFLAFTAHGIYNNEKFDMVNFGLAYGALLAAGATGVKLKESSEPTAIPPPKA